ncbi:hypothetical protein GEMRC1_004923 [Eukaryota sp. GEM-RC1]
MGNSHPTLRSLFDLAVVNVDTSLHTCSSSLSCLDEFLSAVAHSSISHETDPAQIKAFYHDTIMKFVLNTDAFPYLLFFLFRRLPLFYVMPSPNPPPKIDSYAAEQCDDSNCVPCFINKCYHYQKSVIDKVKNSSTRRMFYTDLEKAIDQLNLDDFQNPYFARELIKSSVTGSMIRFRERIHIFSQVLVRIVFPKLRGGLEQFRNDYDKGPFTIHCCDLSTFTVWLNTSISSLFCDHSLKEPSRIVFFEEPVVFSLETISKFLPQ